MQKNAVSMTAGLTRSQQRQRTNNNQYLVAPGQLDEMRQGKSPKDQYNNRSGKGKRRIRVNYLK